jgi:hypothetical protein
LGAGGSSDSNSAESNKQQSQNNADRFLVRTQFFACPNASKTGRFDVHHLCTNILAHNNRIRPAGTEKDAGLNFVLNFRNAYPHTTTEIIKFLRSHRMKRAFRPPFPPYLTPSHFFLFRKLEMELNEAEFEDE